MHTGIFKETEQDINIAANIIKGGGLVAFPTETVYGLGANALNEDAVKAIYDAKGRPSDNPMIVHVGNMAQLDVLVQYVSDDVLKLMKKFWPGPLTFVLPKNDIVPDVVTGGLSTVAVRMPANKAALALINASGCPIAAPSANLSGKPSPTTFLDVLEDMQGKIDGIIEGADCLVGIESTVLDMSSGTPTILRPGFITPAKIEAVIGKSVKYDESLFNKHVEEDDSTPKSPGMKYKHYSPQAQVRLIKGSDAMVRMKMRDLGVVARQQGKKVAMLDYDGDAAKAANRFFADLRELDRQGYDLILVRTLDEEGYGFSIMNRMVRSAGYDIVED